MNSGKRELEAKKERNLRQRREFVKYWANYVKEHDDEEWSEQQNLVVDSQLENTGNSELGDLKLKRFAD